MKWCHDDDWVAAYLVSRCHFELLKKYAIEYQELLQTTPLLVVTIWSAPALLLSLNVFLLTDYILK